MLSRLLHVFILLLFLSIPSLSQEITIPFQQVPNAPYFQSPQITIDSEEYDTLILRMDSRKSGTARLFWVNNYDTQFNYPKSIWFSIKAGEHNYTFNIPSQNPNWIGWIKGFLIHPEVKPELINIRQVKVVKGNLFTNIRSGWVEFWGPRGRIVKGSTVNNIQTSVVFAKPVNWYIFGIIIVTAVFSFCYFYFKTGNYNFSWKKCGKFTILTAIIFWALLEANASINQYNQLKQDFITYGFGPIETKHAAAIGKDFYNFLQFCKKNLPKGAKVKLLFSEANSDFYTQRMNYFLYPYFIRYEKPINYIIVYNYDKGISTILAENNTFVLFKRYSETAYILEKRSEE